MPLIREFADGHGTGFRVTSSSEVVESETLNALQTVTKTLESKAPDELEPYREFVLQIADRVCLPAAGALQIWPVRARRLLLTPGAPRRETEDAAPCMR